MFVRDYMTPDPITVSPNTTFPEAMSVMRQRRIRRLPVVESNRLIGIVVEKDMLSNQPSQATTLSVFEIYGLLEKLRVRQFMSRPVFTVEGDCTIEEAARIMVENKFGCLPVMDGDELVGIITETDIFKILVEVLGGQESGCRLTLSVPDRVGELARITSRIAEVGGYISAVTSSRQLADLRREVTIKESGIEPETLKDLLRGSDIEIIDIRSSARYQPKQFG